MHTIQDLRKHLFDTIEGVKNGTMDVTKAKTIADTAQVVINTAKVEVEFMRMRGKDSHGTGFVPEQTPQITGTPEAPRLVHGKSQSGSR